MSKASPYPGLRPFERHETDIFFGREEHTDQLLERLDHVHFLAVIGPSGCGKSSLVRTGLLAGLETGFLVSAGARWRVAEMRPGNQPFARLADALLAEEALGPEYVAQVTSYFTDPAETTAFLAADSHRAMLQAQLRRGPYSIHELLEHAPPPQHTRLLLLVDQFEEIFRHYHQGEGEENEAAAFVSLLLTASQHADVYVVITMRSDFLGDCALFHGLPEAINQGLFLTPRLHRDQLRAAIEEPAGVFGGKLEPALVNRLLNDMGNDPDQLPVLQHALMRMWSIASAQVAATDGHGDSSITLTMAHYTQIGGLDTALSQHADEAYNELNADQQHVAEVMFRSLSERGSDRRDTRRPVALGEVATLAQVPWQEVAAVVEVFRQAGRSFLTPPVGRALPPDSVLDISHESLIRQWQRLQDWTTQEAGSAELYTRLEDSARRWQEGYVALWRTPELEYALDWRERAKPTAVWAQRYGKDFDLAIRFLDASAAQQREEVQQAEAVQQRELRRARRQVGILLLGFVVVAILALWGYGERNKALATFKREEMHRKQAEAMEQKAAVAASDARMAQQRAEESFQQARGVVDDFLTQLSDEKVNDVPGFQPVRKELVAVALKYYKEFIQQRSHDPSIQTELGHTYFNIGKITNALGSAAEALQAYDEAVQVQSRLLAANPDHPNYLSNLGLTYYSIGEMHMFASRAEEALQYFEKARLLQERLVYLYPDIDQYPYELGNTFNRLGSTYTDLKRSEEAEHWFNRSLEIHLKLASQDPEEPKYKLELSRGYNNLSILHNQEGRKTERLSSLQKAAETIEELLRKHPNVQHYRALAAVAYSNLGNAQVHLGNHENAKQSLQKAIVIATRLGKENPFIPKYKEHLADSYYIMVDTLKQHDKLDGAITAYRELLEAKPDHTDAWDSLGRLLQKQDKLDDAIVAYRRQVEVTPTHAYAWNNLGWLLQKQDKLDDAIVAYRRQVEVTPTHAHAWNNLGRLLQKQDKLDDAIVAYQRQVEVTPTHAYAWNNLGWLLQKQDKLDDAIVAYQRQVEVQPDHADAWDNLGLALEKQSKLDDAIASYRRQAEVTPDHAWAWNHLGNALRAQGKLDEAIAAYRKQLDIAPQHEDAWHNLGWALQQQGKLDEALAAYRKQLEITPTHAWAWNNLGWALQQQGKLDEALVALQRQAEVTPNHEMAWHNIGVVLYLQGKREEALTALQNQVQIKPDHVEAWNVLGVILWKLGNDNAAAAAFAKGLAVQPTHLSLLSNDMELALAQGDRTRLENRMATAMPQVTPDSELYAILPFLAWLANPAQGWGSVENAISKLEPEITFAWDFSDTKRALTHLPLDTATQQIAHHFIDYFEGRVALPTLKARIRGQ